ncbi:hypothetical protein P3L10_008526 [Capsicum annuum]
MASKGLDKGRHKKGKKGTDNLLAGQYTPPPVTKTLQQGTINIFPPQGQIFHYQMHFSCPHCPTTFVD